MGSVVAGTAEGGIAGAGECIAGFGDKIVVCNLIGMGAVVEKVTSTSSLDLTK